MINARTQTRARAIPAPDINKCAFIAALISATLMMTIGLLLG